MSCVLPARFAPETQTMLQRFSKPRCSRILAIAPQRSFAPAAATALRSSAGGQNGQSRSDQTTDQIGGTNP